MNGLTQSISEKNSVHITINERNCLCKMDFFMGTTGSIASQISSSDNEGTAQWSSRKGLPEYQPTNRRTSEKM